MSEAWGLPKWFLPVLQSLVAEVFFLIAFGAAVRAMNSGLACPDWPLCFGEFIPDYHPQVYFEFIHRVLAGVIGIVTVVLNIWLIFKSRAPGRVKALGAASVLLLLTQIVFGGLTVLLKLQAGVVAAHLAMGTGFFAVLTWLLLTLKGAPKDISKAHLPKWLRYVSFGFTGAVYAQILLGGLVASNYAALACIDFPTCHGEWFPRLEGAIGIHMVHRFGAYTVAVLALAYVVTVFRSTSSRRLRNLALWIAAMVAVQITLGVANILLLTPPLITVAHLAVATMILGLAVRLSRYQLSF
jgi:cytochrome c oxidase assembly protein subunit 15